jgi:serine/threonine protein kinase
LCHKHIAQLFGYFHDEFNVYMVLEYYANQNIYYYLKSHRTLSERDVARFKGVLCFRFFLQIVSAVDYMHKRNIIHRDLKLENLFLDEYLNIRVGDLGYAVHTLGQRDTYCGTLSYMTKEQIDQKPYGKEVDIWALGILLFEIALSKSPFLGNEEKETIENVKNHRLIFPEEKSIGP